MPDDYRTNPEYVAREKVKEESERRSRALRDLIVRAVNAADEKHTEACDACKAAIAFNEQWSRDCDEGRRTWFDARPPDAPKPCETGQHFDLLVEGFAHKHPDFSNYGGGYEGDLVDGLQVQAHIDQAPDHWPRFLMAYPPALSRLAKRLNVEPEWIITGYIGDLLTGLAREGELADSDVPPTFADLRSTDREDGDGVEDRTYAALGFSTSGSDERDRAVSYFKRTGLSWAHVPDGAGLRVAGE